MQGTQRPDSAGGSQLLSLCVGKVQEVSMKVFPEIDERMAAFIRAQQMFFVSTAPLDGDGFVNLSPKGLDTFEILDPLTVAYVDFVGSGVETISHLRENGRIVFMFCAFESPPKIVRLHGVGDVLEPGDAEWDEVASRLPTYSGTRAIVRAKLHRIADSCGYGVPLYDYVSQREQMTQWAERKGPDGLTEYKAENNEKNLDGLPSRLR
jgi:hypothetical protein